MNLQRLTILGSTGSVGTSTLDVVARHLDRFEIFALSANTQVETILAQIVKFNPTYVVMASEPHAVQLADKVKINNLKTVVLSGEKAIEMIASHESVEIVMAPIVGAAGLASFMAGARTG